MYSQHLRRRSDQLAVRCVAFLRAAAKMRRLMQPRQQKVDRVPVLTAAIDDRCVVQSAPRLLAGRSVRHVSCGGARLPIVRDVDRPAREAYAAPQRAAPADAFPNIAVRSTDART